MAESNPLLALNPDEGDAHRAAALPFAAVEPAHVVPAVEALIAKANAALDAVEECADARSYENTVAAYEGASDELDLAMTLVSHLESVVSTPELRQAHEQAQLLASAFYATIALRPKLYAALSSYAESEEGSKQPPLRARFLKKSLDAFKKNGADLNDEGKGKLQQIAKDLAQATTRFTQNVLAETDEFELLVEDEGRLAGLPDGAKAAAEAAARAKDKSGWLFTLQAPSYIAAMTYLEDRPLRETMWRAYNTRATKGERDNRNLIADILRLRREKAALLGFDDFADFILKDRMAKNGDRAFAFVDDLRQRTHEAFMRETSELESFAKVDGGMAPWDVAFYAERLRKERFDFDDEALRPYFSVPGVLGGLFELVQSLYGVRIAPYEAEGWHESVDCYGIYEGERLLCTFFVDLFPRKGKRGGAWMNAFIYGLGDQPHVGLFCANVTPPIGNKAALLTHREVETLFHEFGHLLHHALSDVPLRSLGGTNVAWDFVELPSQIMENFCWERTSLDQFARHVDTGDAIPDALFEKMRAARTYRAATAQMRQLGFANVDLRLHREFADFGEGAGDRAFVMARDVLAEHATTALPDDYGMICAFSHLFSSPVGYAAAYYSYKWAEVLDADAFTAFASDGVVSAKVGKAFREALLSKGDSDDPEALYERFMGREPDLQALLVRSGLATS
ncbi:MAG: M3 family metallopeptidase [Myxococcota bacterium]